jgi:hypothetical protein
MCRDVDAEAEAEAVIRPPCMELDLRLKMHLFTVILLEAIKTAIAIRKICVITLS